jgi:MFS family permease
MAVERTANRGGAERDNSVRQAAPELTPSQVRRNERLNYLQLMWAGPYVIILQQYIPVLATRLGASALLLGILSSGAALMLTVGTLTGRWWLQRGPADMRSVVFPVIGARSIVLWVPLVLLFAAHRPEMLVAATIASSLFLGLVQVAFMTVLPRMTFSERVSTMISGRWTVLGIGMAAGIPLMAGILDAFPLPLNYVIVCGFAILTTIGECATFMHWRPRLHTSQPLRRSARTDLGVIWRHAASRRYLFLTFLGQLGLSSIAPLVPLQIVRHLQANNVQYGWYSAIAWLAIALTGILRPRLIRRYGNGLLYGLAGIGLALEALTLGLAISLPYTWLAGALGGVALGLFQVTAFGLIIESAPDECYESFVSIQASIGNFAVFIAPLLTSSLVSLGCPLGLTLLLCAGIRGLASVLALRTVGRTQQREPLSAPAG